MLLSVIKIRCTYHMCYVMLFRVVDRCGSVWTVNSYPLHCDVLSCAWWCGCGVITILYALIELFSYEWKVVTVRFVPCWRYRAVSKHSDWLSNDFARCDWLNRMPSIPYRINRIYSVPKLPRTFRFLVPPPKKWLGSRQVPKGVMWWGDGACSVVLCGGVTSPNTSRTMQTQFLLRGQCSPSV